MAEAQKDQARAGRDIGPIPPIKDPRRRKRALASLRAFCMTYLAEAFPWPFSDDQLKVIAKIERAVLKGGNFAEAMPRSSGKSTIARAALLWAALTGARKYIVLVAAVDGEGAEMVDKINKVFETNDLLLEDFPEVVYPFRCLEQSNNRSKGQRCLGNLTFIERTSGKLVFPTIAGSLSSGVVIFGTGIEGGKTRGRSHTTADGRVIRPDMFIIDDFQTDESAWSIPDCIKRERAIRSKILGMAGPGTLPAAIICGTVIRRGDAMDNLLDRKKHPEWQGERMKQIYAFPTKIDLWEEYGRILREDLASDGDGSKARAYYRKNRKAMDEGAVVAWKHRKEPGHLSALEWVMRLFLLDRETFFSEHQNEPVEEECARKIMTADQIAAKQNGLERGSVPDTCSRLTAFVDVHLEVLYWMVMAWEDDFTGYVVDYGTYPDQHRSYFLLREAKRTLGDAAKPELARRGTKLAGPEGAIYLGLETLVNSLAGREFVRDDDAVMRIERIMIDANWGQTTSLVKQFCRQSIHSAILLPSHGHYYGARNKPLSQYEKKRGERLERDYCWHIPKAPHRQVRHIVWDTNWWKSFAHGRLGVAIGDPGCVSLFASNDHRLLADHLTAETPTHTEGHGRNLDEWEQRPGTDNHWFDCFVGCMVAASERGCKLAVLPGSRKRRERHGGGKRLSLSELQAKRRLEGYGAKT